MSTHPASRNRLLDALSDEAWERLAPNLQPVEMRAGTVLHEPGRPLQDAYFPTSSIVSKVCMMQTGASAEIALVGREGMVDVALFLGGRAPLDEARVQHAGHGLKLSAQHLRSEFDRGGSLMRVLLLYTHALLAQIVQTAACNRHGTLEQRLCRWLLMSLDRASGNELAVTQELIAHVLGVRRESVTEAAGRLQQHGAIRYRRGHILVVDRDRLEAGVCECYAGDEHEAGSFHRRQLSAAARPRRCTADRRGSARSSA